MAVIGKGLGQFALGDLVGRRRLEVDGIFAFEDPGRGPPVSGLLQGHADGPDRLDLEVAFGARSSSANAPSRAAVRVMVLGAQPTIQAARRRLAPLLSRAGIYDPRAKIGRLPNTRSPVS